MFGKKRATLHRKFAGVLISVARSVSGVEDTGCIVFKISVNGQTKGQSQAARQIRGDRGNYYHIELVKLRPICGPQSSSGAVVRK